MAKSTTPATTEQLEIDQMAEIELDRLHKQVRKFSKIKCTPCKLYVFMWSKLILQLRKMEKDRNIFLDGKKFMMAKRERLLDTLKRERNQLQERLMALHHGPHARKESKVNKITIHFSNLIDIIQLTFDCLPPTICRPRKKFNDCCGKRKRLPNRWMSKKFNCGN